MTNTFSIGGSGVGGNGALNFSNSGNFNLMGAITLTSDTTICTSSVTQTLPITFTGGISGNGGLTFFNQTSSMGVPTFRISTTPATYSGDTTLISSATGAGLFSLDLAVANALPATNIIFGGTSAGASGTFNSKAVLSLNGILQTLAGISVSSGASGTYNVIGNSTTTSTLVVNTTNDAIFSGILGGTGTNNNNFSLTKSGGGALFLTGANTYAGGTDATAGTIGGTGALDGANTVGSNATHASDVGTSAVQNVNGNYTLNGILTVDFSGATVFDQVNVTGTVTLNNATLSVSTIFSSVSGRPVIIINNYGSDAISGTCANLPQGDVAQVGGKLYTNNYKGGDGNDVALTFQAPVKISQFRLSGPCGPTDEFVELANTTTSAIDLTGWTLGFSNVADLTGLSLSGKTIPAGGRLLVTNSGGYSLGTVYPAGGSMFATGDVTYKGDIALNSTFTLFNPSSVAVDTVGNLSGIAPTSTMGQYAYVKRQESGTALDIGIDSTDFNLVDVIVVRRVDATEKRHQP